MKRPFDWRNVAWVVIAGRAKRAWAREGQIPARHRMEIAPAFSSDDIGFRICRGVRCG